MLCLVHGATQAQVVADAGADQTVCSGAATILGGSQVASGGTGPYTYAWSHGATAANPTIYPTTNGSYTVTVTDNLGATATDQIAITVRSNPNVLVDDPNNSFKKCTSQNDTCTRFTFYNFTSANNLQYHWDFGDGQDTLVKSKDTVGHVFCGYGNYTITVIGTDTLTGCADTFVTTPLTYKKFPVASMQIDSGSTTSCGGDSALIHNNSTNGVYFTWEWGDGTTDTTYDLRSMFHKYDTAGLDACGQPAPGYTFDVTLRAYNECNLAGHHNTSPIYVVMPPLVIFSAPDTVCITDMPVKFTNTSCPQNGYQGAPSYQWTFGDGQSSSLRQPWHTYADSGCYQVRLIGSNECAPDTLYHNILVALEPDPMINLDVTSGCVPFTVQTTNLTEQVSCDSIRHQWSVSFTSAQCAPNASGYTFASGTDTSEAPSFTFSNPGIYVITYLHRNSCDTASVRDTVYALDVPQVTIATPDTTCVRDSVFPTAVIDTCLTALDSLRWTFPGGNPGQSVQQSPSGVWYSAAGDYPIYLTAHNTCGSQSDTAIVPVPSVVPAFAGPDTSACHQDAPLTLGPGSPASGVWRGTGITDSASGRFDPGVAGVGVHLIQYQIDYAVCQNFDTLYVEVYANPVVTAMPSRDTLCLGDSVQLQAGGALTYVWSPATTLSCSSCPNPMATPVQSTTYTTTGTDSRGCTGFASVAIYMDAHFAAEAGPDQTLCPGTSTVLTGSGGAQYVWSPAAGLSHPNQASTNATPALATTYTLSVTDTLGCTATDTVRVSHHPEPTVHVPLNDTVCTGDSLTLGQMPVATGGSPTFTYQWSPAASLNQASLANPTATPASTTTYTLVATDAQGCKDTGTTAVEVLTLPNVLATASGPICPGDSATITASGAASYQWLPSASLVCDSCAATEAYPNANTIYTVLGTDNFGCTETDTTLVSVIQVTAQLLSPDTSICAGDSLRLTAAGAQSYSWQPASLVDQPTAANPTAFPPTSQVFTVTMSDASGCVNIDSVLVDVISLPAIQASPDTGICSGSAAQLMANGGSSYQWSPATSLSATNVQSPLATPASTTTYTVIGADSLGCSQVDSVVVTVYALPQAVADSNQFICYGDTARLIGSGGLQYAWSPNTALSCANCAATQASPTTTTIYTLQVRDANQCTDTATVTVQVDTAIQLQLPADTSLCRGDTIQFVASGADTYTWSPAAGLSDSTVSSPFVSPTTSTTYHLLAQNSQGCDANASVRVDVLDLPLVDAGMDTSICPGDTANLAATGAVTYSWTPTASLSNPSAPTTGAHPANSTTYRVIGIDAQGCTNTDTVRVELFSPAVATADSNTFKCFGDTVQLLAGGGIQFSWAPAAQLSCTNCAAPQAWPTSTTTYTVTVTDSHGCSDTASLTVTVDSALQLQLPNDTAICLNDTIQFSVSGASSYAWSPPIGLSDTAIANPYVFPTTSTTYSVEAVNHVGCKGSGQVHVQVNNLPVVDAGNVAAICPGDTTTLQGSGATAYDWSPAGSLASPGNHTTAAFPSVSTTYTLVGIDQHKCRNTDTVRVQLHTPPTAIADTSRFACFGDTVRLYGSGGSQYQWTPSADLSCGSCASPEAWPTTTTVYSLEVTDAQGCTDIDTVTITVDTSIQLTLPPDTGMCIGDTLQFFASGAQSYEWSPGAELSDSTVANPLAFPTSTTTYHLTAANGHGCDAQASVTIQVFTLPVIDAGQDTTVCLGDTASIQATGGIMYHWSPAATLTNPQLAATGAYPTTATMYTLVGTDANQCSNTDSVQVSLFALPTVSADSSMFKCYPDTVTLQASGALTYQWSPANALSCTNCPSPDAWPTTTTTYTLRGRDAQGCENFDSLTLTVDTAVQLAMPNDTAICRGDTIAFSVTGANAYAWSPGLSLSDSTSPNPLVYPTSTTVYTLVAGNSNHCAAQAQVRVEVLDLPSVDAGSDTTVCIGDTASLQATGGLTYHWSPTPTLTSPQLAATGAYPTTATMYTVMGTDANQCSNIDSVQVVLYTLPVVRADSNMFKCFSDTVQLQASGALTYQWTPATTLSCAQCTAPSAWPTMTTTYTLQGRDAQGCRGQDTVTITVDTAVHVVMPNDTAICIGDTIAFSVTGANAYAWSPGLGLSDSTIPNPKVFPTNSTTYTLQAGNSLGCGTKAQVHIDVLNLPVADAGNDTSICLGDTARLQGSGGLDYAWSPTPTLSQPTSANTLTWAMQPTTFTLTVTDVNHCVNTDTVRLGIYALPVVQADSSTFKCFADTVALSASGALSYAWLPVQDLSCTSCAQTQAWPTTSTIYTVTGTDALGCKASDSVNIQVDTLVQLALPADTGICRGDTIVFSVSGAQTYAWQPGTGLGDSTSGTTTVYPNQPTTYTLHAANSHGCGFTDSVVIDVYDLPNAFAGSDTALCIGDTIVLQASGGISYAWTPTASLSDPAVPTPSAFPTATTDYVVAVTDVRTCTQTDTVSIGVYQLPLADAGRDTTICRGDTGLLMASGGLHYQWSPSIYLGCDTCRQSTTFTDSSRQYHVRVTDSNTCVQYDSVRVHVIDIPTVTASSDTSTCLGDSVRVSAQGALTYQWSPMAGLGTPNAASTQAAPPTVTDLIVTGTDINGCRDRDTVRIIVHQTPIVEFAADTVCLGTPTSFTNQSTDTSLGGLTYLWDFGDSIQSQAVHPQHIYGDTGQHTVKLTAENIHGCSSTRQHGIPVHLDPIITITADTVCAGDTTTLLASTTATGGQWQWDLGDGTVIQGIDLVRHRYGQAGAFLAHATYTQPGCASSKSIVVIASTLIEAQFGSFPGDSLCVEEAMHFTDSSQGNPVSWYWNFGDGHTSRHRHPMHRWLDTGVYVVQMIAANGNCRDTATQDVLVLYSAPVADFLVDTVCVGAATTFTNNSTDTFSMTYVWDFGDQSGAVATSPTHIYPDTGEYGVQLIATNSAGCSDTTSRATYVSPQPHIELVADTVCVGMPSKLTIQSDATAGAYYWSFGDGSTDTTLTSTTHAYGTAGVYQVQVTFRNGSCIDDTTAVARVRPAIQTRLVRDLPDTSCIDLVHTFRDTSSGSPEYWIWQFGDGNTASTPTATHAYAHAGSYQVLLRSGHAHCESTDSIIITIETPPAIDFAADTVCLGSPTSFTGFPAGQPTQWLWTFGDGNTGFTAPNASYIYPQTGIYPASLALTYRNGCMALAEHDVWVAEVPEADFIADSVCPGELTSFTDLSQGMVQSWLWDFGAAGTNPLQHPQVLMPDAGDHLVELTINAGTSCEASAIRLVHVHPHVTADFVGTDTLSAVGHTIDFFYTGVGAVDWSWDFGDGSFAYTENTYHYYDMGGEYTITLDVENAFGCTDRDSFVFVYVRDDENLIWLPNAFTPNNDGKNDVLYVRTLQVAELDFKVYDRWGELLFVSDNPDHGWDGNFRGNPVNTGVYVYVVRATLSNGRVFNRNGTVGLMR